MTFFRAFFLTIAAGLSLSCGMALTDLDNFGRAPPRQVRSIDPAFQAYVSDFELYFATEVDYPIQFGDTGADSIGLCYKWIGGYKEIVLSEKYWNKIDNNQRRELVYHELGHCQLGLDHNDTETTFPDIGSGSYPASIMRSYVFDSVEAQIMLLQMDYYLKQLRNSIK